MVVVAGWSEKMIRGGTMENEEEIRVFQLLCQSWHINWQQGKWGKFVGKLSKNRVL
jgi:hypothetical protein